MYKYELIKINIVGVICDFLIEQKNEHSTISVIKIVDLLDKDQ